MKNLDPRTKIIVLISISMAALFVHEISLLIGLLLFTIILMQCMGVSLIKQKRKLMACMSMILFVILLQSLFGQFEQGIILGIRLAVIILSAELIMTGKPRDYLLAMIQCKMPYELAYMVILAFHFFPLLREEAMDVYYSIQLRGTELKKTSLRNKVVAYRSISRPILAGALGRARDTSAAMEARGFRSAKNRTYMRKLKLKTRDIVVMGLIIIVSGTFIWFSSDFSGEYDYKFIVMGDVQYNDRATGFKEWGDFIKTAYDDNEDAKFIIMTGDMVEKGADESEWNDFLSNGEYVFSKIPLRSAVGNHESPGSINKYKEMLDLPGNEEYYSFDYNDCHFTALNSCIYMEENTVRTGYDGQSKTMTKWLEQDLKNSDKKWKIVYFHHPMYPVAEDDEIYARLRQNWEKILVENDVDVVFCGHQHVYMRSEELNGITHIMLRSGQKESKYLGADEKYPPYVVAADRQTPCYMSVEVYEEEMKFTVKDVNGDVIDEFKKGP